MIQNSRPTNVSTPPPPTTNEGEGMGARGSRQELKRFYVLFPAIDTGLYATQDASLGADVMLLFPLVRWRALFAAFLPEYISEKDNILDNNEGKPETNHGGSSGNNNSSTYDARPRGP